MFKNKNEGKNNLCGENIRKLRLSYSTRLSQRGLADKMQLIGIDVDKNAILIFALINASAKTGCIFLQEKAVYFNCRKGLKSLSHSYCN